MPNSLFLSGRLESNHSTEAPHSFTVQLHEPLYNVQDLMLSNVSFVNFPYYSFPTYESYFKLSQNGGADKTFQINQLKVYDSPADATGTNLIDELNALWTAQSLTGTWAYDDDIKRLYLSGLVASTTTLNFKTHASQIYRRIGLAKAKVDTVITADADGNIYMDNPPIIARSATAYLGIGSTNNSLTSASNVKDVISQIPISNYSYGSCINYEIAYDFSDIKDLPYNFSSLTFNLYDDNFKPLELCENSNVMVAFHIDYFKPQDKQPVSMRKPL